MRIIISPAKKMKQDTDSLTATSLPQFLPEAETLRACLQKMTPQELQALWKCNDSIAALNGQRLKTLSLKKNLTPALLSYEGIQYQYMAPGVFEDGHFDYINEHLRILSGFYGLLCPFDGVIPYRLEMQAKLAVGNHRDLYAFWGNKLAKQLARETDTVLNLSSQEYSRAVAPHLPPGIRLITCTFGEEQDGKIISKGTLCKMARGQMVRWLAERQITTIEAVTQFNQLGYEYAAAASGPNHFIFIKEPAN